MSLIDALLLDPARIDVYVALRQDESSGSSTHSDPWNGGLRLATTEVSVSSLSIASQTATLTTASAHGYADGDLVLISGATDPLLNGVFFVLNKTATTFQISTNEVATSAAGSLKVRKVTELRFDTIMADVTKAGIPNVCVHLGPGVFYTRGYHDGITGSWQIQSGQRIAGSGLGVTTLRMLNNTASKSCYAIGHALTRTSPSSAPNRVDLAEVADMSIDANLAAAAATSSAGALRMMGNHARAVRVRAVNFGTKDATKPCMAFAMLTGNTNSGSSATNELGVANCGLSECAAVKPNFSTLGPVTAFHVGPSEAGGSTEAVGVGPYIQNCFADFTLPTSPNPSVDLTKDFRGLSMAWCVGGVVSGNSIFNCKFGGPIDITTAATAFGAKDVLVTANVYRNVAVGMAWQMSSAGIRRLRVFDNLIELTVTTGLTTLTVNGSNAGVYGLILDDLGAGSPPHGDVELRGNWVRYLDGAAGTGSAMQVNGATSVLMAGNTLDVSPADPLRNNRCTTARYSENRTSPGALVRGFNWGNSTRYNELATEAEEAWILGFLKRA